MVREPASGIFRQVDQNGLQTDEEAVRGDQAEREQTLLIRRSRDSCFVLLGNIAAALLVMKFVRERRRRLLVVERPPAVGGEGRHRRIDDDRVQHARRCRTRFDSNDQDDGRSVF